MIINNNFNDPEKRLAISALINLVTKWQTWFFEDPNFKINWSDYGKITFETIKIVRQDLIKQQRLAYLNDQYLEQLLAQGYSPLFIQVKLGQLLDDLVNLYYQLATKSKNTIKQRLKIYQSVSILFQDAQKQTISFETLIDEIKVLLKANGWKDPTKRRKRANSAPLAK